MQEITWTDALETGVALMDEQHQGLVALINQLLAAHKAGQDTAALAETIADLNAYADSHFREEEELMRSFAYPHAAAHMAQHAEFTTRSVDFLMDVLEDKEELPTEVLEYLSQWLVRHIQNTDRLLGAFLRSKNAA